LNRFWVSSVMAVDYTFYGGVAGFSVPDEVTEQAHASGYFVLKRQGDTFAVDAQKMKAF
jgi:hypothetical protein